MTGPPNPAEESGIGAALASVVERIAQAAARSGRDPASTRLIAVSKTVGLERIRELVALGHTLLGENRVQEALEKMDCLDGAVTFHLIGQLQRNKARHAVGRFELIHGVDSEPLAVEIDRRAALAGIRQAILLQVNLANEPTKGGVEEHALPDLAATVSRLDNIDLRGLMAIPPPVDVAEQSRVWFARLRHARDSLVEGGGPALPELSMGMTDDFEIAVEEGATLVRVGRAIFGARR
jgi:pyridoxal phosphate enzyme (YggS family)